MARLALPWVLLLSSAATVAAAAPTAPGFLRASSSLARASASRPLRATARASLSSLRMAASPSAIYLVTGSTDGIGQHTASNLAMRPGATVLVHGRKPDRVQATVAELSSRRAEGAEVEGLVADLSSFQDVRRLASEVTGKLDRIGGEAPFVLVNNAGVFEHGRRESVEQLEMTFAVNVAAPFLLTGLLLPALKARRGSRVVNVSSISQGGRVPWDDLQLAQPGAFSDHRAYSLSKLLMAIYSMELAARHGRDADLPVLCCDPGTVDTKMLRAGWSSFGIDVSAANDETYLATDPAVAKANGKYFVGRRDVKANSEAYDPESRQKLWAALEQITGLAY